MSKVAEILDFESCFGSGKSCAFRVTKVINVMPHVAMGDHLVVDPAGKAEVGSFVAVSLDGGDPEVAVAEAARGKIVFRPAGEYRIPPQVRVLGVIVGLVRLYEGTNGR